METRIIRRQLTNFASPPPPKKKKAPNNFPSSFLSLLLTALFSVTAWGNILPSFLSCHRATGEGGRVCEKRSFVFWGVGKRKWVRAELKIDLAPRCKAPLWVLIKTRGSVPLIFRETSVCVILWKENSLRDTRFLGRKSEEDEWPILSLFPSSFLYSQELRAQ